MIDRERLKLAVVVVMTVWFGLVWFPYFFLSFRKKKKGTGGEVDQCFPTVL